MKKLSVALAGFALAVLPATPALAGWKLVSHGAAVTVAPGTMQVTPGADWNRSTSHPMKKGETWTLDGETLNELYFVSGLAAGEALYREVDKKNRPLPKLAANAQLTDIPEFFESSNRVLLNTSVFGVNDIAPARLGGHDAVKFDYHYAVQGSTLVRNGIAIGTLVNGQLYLISFTAPAIFYFDRDRAEAEAIMDSAKI